MSYRPTALVIGAGLGGIAAAARLASRGYRVTVLEKNARPGGRCDQLVRDGHRFDIGPTLFLMPAVFEETYAALCTRMEEHLDLHRIDLTYCVRFDDDTQLSLTSDLNAMQSQLEALEPVAFVGLLRYLAEGYTNYHLSLKQFVGRNFFHLLQYFSPQNLPLLFKLKALVKHYCNVGHYFDDSHLKAAFTFQNMYLGLSPYDAPATYSLLQYTEMAEGVWYPLGGLYRVIESMESIAQSLGVRFVYNEPVKQIEARSEVINRLAKMGADDLEQHLKFEITYTPCEWLNLYNLAKGSAFGLSHDFWQVGYLRPHNRHARYRNLYFVGSSTHPGTGLPMVLLSARLTTERIMQEIGMPESRRVAGLQIGAGQPALQN